MKYFHSQTGITIKDLKRYINSIPDTDPSSGEDYEVWVMNPEKNVSNICMSICKLNKGDIIIDMK